MGTPIGPVGPEGADRSRSTSTAPRPPAGTDRPPAGASRSFVDSHARDDSPPDSGRPPSVGPGPGSGAGSSKRPVADRRMRDTDALLWTMDRDPLLRTTIVAVAVVDRPPRPAELAARLEQLTAAVPRLRARAVPGPLGWGRPRWVDDGRFDPDVQLRRVAVPAPHTLREVLDLAQAEAATAFDPQWPLWQVLVVEGLAGGSAALVLKVHHAVVDGIGGLQILERVMDGTPDRRQTAHPQYAAKAAAGAHTAGGHIAGDGAGTSDAVGHVVARSGSPGLLPGLPAPAATLGGAVLAGWHVVVGMSRAGAAAMSHPAAAVRTLADGTRSVVRLLLPAPAPLSTLMAGRGLGRRFEALEVSLEDLRRAAAAVGAGATINDVFVAAVIGGVQRYHRHHGVALHQLRVLMPVSVRAQDDPVATNRFVPTRLVLPADVADPATRIRMVSAATTEWKHAPALRFTDLLAAVLGHLPPQAALATFGSMLKGCDVVVTNVPGFASEPRLAGARLQRFYAFAPPSGAAVNVALLGVADRGGVGVDIDTAAVPDGPVLARELRRGFDEVLALARRTAAAVAPGTARRGGR